MAARLGTDPAVPPAADSAEDGAIEDPTAVGGVVPLDGDGEELVGAIIDRRYRIEATIGRGGMGLVYRASHVGMRRQVALKILHPSLAVSSDVRNRFEREALSVGRIDHPNCVATFDVGRLGGGALYLAMELLEGHSLADLLERDRRLEPLRAFRILAHVLRGLASVHRAGLIHRDIKPENIFLIRTAEDAEFAKILDFGIAKPIHGEIDDGVRLTQAGMAFGTPIYMAPEQALGAPMDGRADLYATAVVGYEMLVGRPPFYSDDKLEVMSMHTAKPVPAMKSLLAAGSAPVPAWAERLIARGLTKKPADRYASAEEFVAAIEHAVTAYGDADRDDMDAHARERRPSTGSEPLVSDSGSLSLASAGDDMDVTLPRQSTGIGAAIDAALDDAIASEVARERVVSGAAPPIARDRRTSSAIQPATASATGGMAIEASAALPAAAAPALAAPAPAAPPRAAPSVIAAPPARANASRWPLYVGIAALAVAGGIAAAVVTAHARRTGEQAAIASANAALDRGDVDGAIAILAAEGSAIANDAAGQRVLGHAQAARSAHAPALAAYGRALAIDPSLEADAELRADLRTMAAAKDPDTVAGAFELWAARTQDPQAKPALQKAAVSDDGGRRHAALRVIAADHLEAGVDWLNSYNLDLQQGATCEERKAAVVKLRALNDRRAVPVLERAKTREGATGGKNRLINSCLIDAANEAIGYLNGLGSGSSATP